MFTAGKDLFNTHCAKCHGPSASGTDQGPSLLWRIYAPSHHSDDSFYLAVQQGVRAHHWRFGNMLPIPDVTRDEVTQVIAYVRWLQQQAGVH
jgi:mono/diheme cytochrome c family protein